MSGIYWLKAFDNVVTSAEQIVIANAIAKNENGANVVVGGE